MHNRLGDTAYPNGQNCVLTKPTKLVAWLKQQEHLTIKKTAKLFLERCTEQGQLLDAQEAR